MALSSLGLSGYFDKKSGDSNQIQNSWANTNQTTDYNKQFNQSRWDPSQQNVSNQFGQYFANLGQPSQGYQGQMVAGMSQNEQAGQQRLSQYLNQGTPQTYGQANTAISNALTGNYQPVVNTGYRNELNTLYGNPIVDTAATDKLAQSIYDQTMNVQLPAMQRGIAENANLQGMYYSGKHGEIQNQAVGDVATNLANTIANLKYQDEMARRSVAQNRENTMAQAITQDEADRRNAAMARENRTLAAVSPALQVGSAEQGIPLQQAQAASLYGNLPRSIEQARNDAAYQEFLRTQAENNPQIAQALQYLAMMGNLTGTEAGQNTLVGSNLGGGSNFNSYQGTAYGGSGNAGWG